VLSTARANSLLQGQRSNAQKLYTHVPAASVWSLRQILDDARRVGTTSPTYDIAEACMRSLKDAGLIRETPAGFIREPVKAPPVRNTITMKEDSTMPVAAVSAIKTSPEPEKSPFDKLGFMAGLLRIQSKQLLEWADELDNIAVEIESGTEGERKELQDLRALRDVMKRAMGA
jgi:hypothetical protein